MSNSEGANLIKPEPKLTLNGGLVRENPPKIHIINSGLGIILICPELKKNIHPPPLKKKTWNLKLTTTMMEDSKLKMKIMNEPKHPVFEFKILTFLGFLLSDKW